jgi:hypothetical protein
MISAPLQSSSNPLGARASAFTRPRTINDDSCGSVSSSLNSASSKLPLKQTACTTPVPSRTCRKWSFPLERLW